MIFKSKYYETHFQWIVDRIGLFHDNLRLTFCAICLILAKMIIRLLGLGLTCFWSQINISIDIFVHSGIRGEQCSHRYLKFCPKKQKGRIGPNLSLKTTLRSAMPLYCWCQHFFQWRFFQNPSKSVKSGASKICHIFRTKTGRALIFVVNVIDIS